MKKLILLAAVLLVSVTFSYAQFTLTSIDYPGGTLTTTRGINNHGDIVGAYRTTGVRHALLIKGGKFFPLAPTTDLGTKWSEAFKINDRGDVVGVTHDDNGFTHGFLLRNGVLTTLDFPGANETYAIGLNDSGTVAGWWNLYDSDGNFLYQGGFIWNAGNFTDVTFPGAGDTASIGINARGDVVGAWDLGLSATTASGFVFSKGQFTSFDAPFPGVWLTQGDDINDTGKIVGQYYDDITYQPRGFLKVGDAFTSIDYPGASYTTAWGINSAGQMVGNWRDSSNAVHGWLAEPSNRCAAAPSDLIAWWPGDGNAQDIVSGANGVTMGAGYAMATVKKGFTFDGVDDYVDVPNPLSLPEILTAVTVAAWVNPQMPEGEGWVFALRDPLITEGISLYMNSDGYLVTFLQGDNPVASATWNPVIRYDGNWKHIALTADTTTGRVTLFLNGVVVQDEYPGLTGQFVRPPHLFFGQRQRSDTVEGPGMAMHYRGLIDEVQLFNRALAPSEILTIYQAGGNGVCKEVQLDAQALKTLYEFAGADGAYPAADLIRDKAGNLYGTTVNGGTSGYGTVFKLDSNGNETVLHSFTWVNGAFPSAGLIRDDAGNLYGTTAYGGSSYWGTVFKLDSNGNETVLHNFTGMADGAYPAANLIRDKAGNLYGTTAYGGSGHAYSGAGVVFKLDSTGNETVLYTFTGGVDGGGPRAGLIRDDAGNLYGTTYYGGSSGWGTVFKLDSNGNYTVLHSFAGGADGCWPSAGLIRDKAGNLYGTTSWCGTSRGGTVFKVDSAGNETVLYSFIDDFGYQANPFADLVQDKAGNLYGTTVWGGAYRCGTVFRVDRNGNMKVLHDFTRGADGANPYAGLVQDKAGNLYGTTSSGGTYGGGTVFKLLLE